MAKSLSESRMDDGSPRDLERRAYQRLVLIIPGGLLLLAGLFALLALWW